MLHQSDPHLELFKLSNRLFNPKVILVKSSDRVVELLLVGGWSDLFVRVLCELGSTLDFRLGLPCSIALQVLIPQGCISFHFVNGQYS